MRLIQISDTHLSPEKAHFAQNWAPLKAWLGAQSPDLVIHTGDVTVDGADVENDLRHCAGLMRELGLPFRAVPGNHDVGEAGHRHQPVNAERLALWGAHLGPDRWALDVAGWRLIGLNAMIAGSGIAQEAVQLAWLDEVMTASDGRRIAWFLHKPLFIEDPAEGDTGYWSIKPGPRRALLDIIRRHGVALVASGHLHKAHQVVREGTRYVWGPSSAFLVGPHMPPMPGEKRLGAVRYEISGSEITADIVDVPGLATNWLDTVIHEVYPRRPET